MFIVDGTVVQSTKTHGYVELSMCGWVAEFYFLAPARRGTTGFEFGKSSGSRLFLIEPVSPSVRYSST